MFITDYQEKVETLDDQSILQCTKINTRSLILQDNDVSTSLISNFVISGDKILSIIRSLNSKNHMAGMSEDDKNE